MDALAQYWYKSNMKSKLIVPDFALFGERQDLPDILHIEAIKDRAGSLDWQISEHRHSRLFQLFVLKSGGGQISIDGQTHQLDAPVAVAIAPRVVHGFRFTQETEGWVITVPVDTLRNCGLLSSLLFEKLSQTEQLRANDDLIKSVASLSERYLIRSPHRRGLLIGQLAIIVSHFLSLHAIQNEAEIAAQKPTVLYKFEEALDKYYRDHWRVADYAKRLGITATHLNRLCQNHFGRPASKIIEANLILKARRALAYTRASISEIAYDLGFVDPAYFSRVFKRATGFTPKAFRTAVNDDN
jgi:AraC family transcriptional activator of pobA